MVKVSSWQLICQELWGPVILEMLEFYYGGA